MKPFQHYKTAHGFGLLATPLTGIGAKRVELDAGTMSARAVFATDSLDRQGDILRVPGIRTEHHQLNPIVLFDHGKSFALPIGKTVDEDGTYTVEIGESEAYQRTFFSQSLLEAEQIYRLIEEGVLSANSIGYRPLKVKRLPAPEGSLQKPGLYLEEVELLEVSWVGVPANQDAVRRALDRGLVCGKSLAPSIRLALAPLVPKTNPTVRGGFAMSKKLLGRKFAKDELVEEPVKDDAVPAAAPAEAPAEPAAPPMKHGAELLTQLQGTS